MSERRLASLWAVAALASAATPAAAAPAGLRPPGLKPEPSSAEAGMWGESDREEAHVRTSAELDQDPALTAYVRGVVCKIAPEYCGELRVYVLDRPFLNATTAPNGYVEVWSGLMLRAQTEDELAYVLGHEVSHFARNHSIERYRTLKTTSNVVLALQVGVTLGAVVAMSGASSSGTVNAGDTIDSISRAAQSMNDLIYLAGMARYYGFSRENETEADRLGYERAVAAGYNPSAGANLWTYVVAEANASEFPTVRKSEARGSVFNTHPITADRIAALSSLGGPPGVAPNLAARQSYRAAIRTHLGPWLKDDLRRRDFGETLRLLDRLEEEGEDLGILEFYRGETHRLRRQDGDAAAALAAYRAATTHEDAPPAAWRELAEALRKQGDRPGAVQALQAYLVHAPNAPDRWLAEASLKSLTAPESP